MCVHVHLWRPEVNIRCLIQPHSLLLCFLCIHFWRQGMSLKFKLSCSARLHGKQAPGTFLPLPLPHSTSLMDYRTLSLPGFCSGSGDPSSGPLAFKANTLTTELSPQPYIPQLLTIHPEEQSHWIWLWTFTSLSECSPSFFWDKCQVARLLNNTAEVCGNSAVAI